MKNIFNRKSVFVKSLSVWSAFAVIITTSAPAFAAGTAVLGGSADLQNLTRATMDKNDPNAAVFSSDAASAVLDWNRFNIGSGQSMSFNGAGTTFFNLVDGAAGRSQIDGIINGSGNVWVINPAGIAFGASSSVNVGGLFAAAAGNLENAAALRDGTATMPSFSSFEGSVDASKGTFTASQVALMGKTVSAEGDFSNVGNLTISATGGAMDVDEVQGGKVSVNIRDFTADGSEVTLGDLHIDGDLTVKATGSIMAGAKAAETPANKPMLLMAEKKGPVIQAGDIDIEGADLEIEGKLQSTAGHVDVLAYGSLDVNAEVNAADYASLQALGDIDVNADVIAGGGDATIYSYNGSVTVEAGKTVSALGNVDITAGMGAGVNGDVTIDGNVESSFGNVMLYSGYGDQSTGDVTINGNVTAEYGGIDAYAGFGYALGTSGKLTVNGNITGYSSVSLKTGNGDIIVGENSVVSATGFGGEVNVSSVADAGYGLMTGEGHSGNVEINGTLKADEAYGQVNVVAGQEAGATGSVTLNGKITSDYYSQLATTKGEVVVNNELTSLGNVMIDTGDGNITIAKDATVESKGGSQGMAWDAEYGMESSPSVVMLGAMDAAGTGNIKIDGTVRASDQNGQIVVKTGYDGNTAGYTGGKGGVEVNGSLSAEKHIELTTLDGNVSLRGERVEVGDEMSITTRGEGSKVAIDAKKGIVVNGDIISAGDVAMTASSGDIEINSDILGNRVTIGSGVAFEYAEIYPGTGVYDFNPVSLSGDGNVTVNGNIYGGSRVILGTDNGDIAIAKNASVSTDGDNSEVDIDAGMRDGIDWTTFMPTEAGKGDVKIDGLISTGNGGITFINSGYGLGASGDIKLDGMVQQTGSGQVELNAGYGLGFGSEMGSEGSVVGSGGIIADSSDLLVTASGDAQFTGIMSVKDATFFADGDITAANKGNDFRGEVTAMGEAFTLKDKNGVDVGNVTVVGEATIMTETGSITLNEGKKISSTGEDGSVNLVSAMKENGLGFVIVNGDVEVSGNNGEIYVHGGYGDGAKGDVAIQGNLTANGNVTLISNNGDTGIVGAGNIKSEKGDLTAIASGAHINLNGKLESQDASFVALDWVSAINDQNDFSGVVSAQGYGTMDGSTSIRLRDVNGVRIGSVSSSGGDIIVQTAKGNVVVDGSATIKTSASGSKVRLESAVAGGDGDVIIESGARVEATSRVELMGDGGNVSIAKEAVVNVTGDNGLVMVASAVNDASTGGVSVNGTITAQGKDGGVQITAGYGNASAGNVEIGGDADVVASGEGGTVFINSKTDGASRGVVVVDGRISAEDYVQIHAQNGEISLGEHGGITAGRTEGTAIRLATVDAAGVGGNVSIAGVLEAKNGGDIHVISETDDQDSAATSVGLGSVILERSGLLKGAGTAFLMAGFSKGARGDLTIKGRVDSKNEAVLATGNGSMKVADSGVVNVDAGKVSIISGLHDNSSGDLIVDGRITAKDRVDGMVSYGEGANGSAIINGSVSAGSAVVLTTGNGDITISRNGGVSSSGSDGWVFLGTADHKQSAGDIVINGNVAANGVRGVVDIVSAKGNGANGDVAISGTVSAGSDAVAFAGYGEGASGTAAVSGSLKAGNEADVVTRSGAISLTGTVSGGKGAKLITGANGGMAGNVSFGVNGQISGGEFVDVVVGRGNVVQSGASVSASSKGYVEQKSFHSSAVSKDVNFNVNGNIGNGTYGFVAVNGRVYGAATGNASIAAGGGNSFVGGSRPSHTPNVNIRAADVVASSASGKVSVDTHVSTSLAQGIDWGGADDNSAIIADGDLSIYTTGALNPYGLLVAGRNLTVSASSFGDMSYLRAGGKLTVNNVGHPSHPQIAYFESVNGVEPNINNLPNDMVIFIDGRLAGGNLNILNKFGANEAFMVETPELKSTQGIFGNPPFLHSDLDVANPMAVSAVDYLIQEVPRLTLSSDFPAEVDQNVEAVGLSQKDVYWFGQKGSDEKKASDEAAEKTAETDKGSEKPSDKTVALVR